MILLKLYSVTSTRSTSKFILWTRSALEVSASEGSWDEVKHILLRSLIIRPAWFSSDCSYFGMLLFAWVIYCSCISQRNGFILDMFLSSWQVVAFSFLICRSNLSDASKWWPALEIFRFTTSTILLSPLFWMHLLLIAARHCRNELKIW